jgi:hypothetical protein
MAISMSMTTFMVIVFIIGLLLTGQSFKLAETSIKCKEEVQRAIRGLIVLSVMMLSCSATYMISNCNTSLSNNTIGTFFIALMLTLGIVITTLSSIIHGNCVESRSDTVGLIVVGTLTIFFTGTFLGYSMYSSSPGSNLKSGF